MMITVSLRLAAGRDKSAAESSKMSPTAHFFILALTVLVAGSRGQEAEEASPDTSALFKNIRLPILNIGIKKPRITKTFPVVRKNVVNRR